MVMCFFTHSFRYDRMHTTYPCAASDNPKRRTK